MNPLLPESHPAASTQPCPAEAEQKQFQSDMLKKSLRDAGFELDPHGLDSNVLGAKLDWGKMKGGVLQDFARALWAVGEVGTFGAQKYTRGGWEHTDDGVTRYHDAAVRHWLKAKVEYEDPDSGLPHLAHMAWNLLASLELHLRLAEAAVKKNL